MNRIKNENIRNIIEKELGKLLRLDDQLLNLVDKKYTTIRGITEQINCAKNEQNICDIEYLAIHIFDEGYELKLCKFENVEILDMRKVIMEEINKKLDQISTLFDECEQLAIKFNLEFTFNHTYGMGGTYYGYDNENGEYGWVASSHTC